jgi:hypothetical protein
VFINLDCPPTTNYDKTNNHNSSHNAKKDTENDILERRGSARFKHKRIEIFWDYLEGGTATLLTRRSLEKRKNELKRSL